MGAVALTSTQLAGLMVCWTTDTARQLMVSYKSHEKSTSTQKVNLFSVVYSASFVALRRSRTTASARRRNNIIKEDKQRTKAQQQQTEKQEAAQPFHLS